MSRAPSRLAAWALTLSSSLVLPGAVGCGSGVSGDASLDGGLDGASVDAEADHGIDAEADLGSDAADFGVDMDADTDASLDAGTDASVDAGTDASLDADTDAGVDAGTDAGADADTDAALPPDDAGTCVPSTPPVELCNGVDDDCNGVVDDAPSDVGIACPGPCPPPDPCVAAGTCSYPTSVCVAGCCGSCTAGRTACTGGTLVCDGGTGPSAEVCDLADDDCDGQIDQGFALGTDPTNCGACGRACALPEAIPGCAAGMCTVLACLPGFGDVDGSPGDGCEYTCPVSPARAESCNGLDDDCDGVVDDGVVPPPSFCVQTGLCAGSSPACAGTLGWRCNYASIDTHIEVDAAGDLARVEMLCDGFDGNCNGLIDESFPNKGRPCTAGVGACAAAAVFVCSADRLSTTCPAVAVPTQARDEQCNGLDDDCDGQIDERLPVGGSVCWDTTGTVSHACLGWRDPMVRVGTTFVAMYESSRPDATTTSQGGLSTRACSKPDVLPWTNVGESTAAAACAAVIDSAGHPMRLCAAPEWTDSCDVGVTPGPVWSYQTNPTVYSASTCNGADAAFVRAWPTGTGPSCFANQAAGRIYDMSGNVDEWTSTTVLAGASTYYKLRGGSYLSSMGGLNCAFDFDIELPTYASNAVGFRCCADAAP